MAVKKTPEKSFFPPLRISRINIILYLIGLVLLIIGFILMSQGPWDNPLSRTVAPLILLLAYVVVFPVAILYKSEREAPKQDGIKPKTK